MDFDGKVALVTGGGAGIGRATAIALAQRGANVTVVDLHPEAAEKTLQEILDRGGRGHAISADVSNPEDVRSFVEATLLRNQHIDCLFNNAGIEGKLGPIYSAVEANFDRVFAVNVRGVFLTLRYVLAAMIQRGKGSVVNTASIAGLGATPDVSSYVASKHAVVGLTRGAAVDVGKYNVRVNAICPGPVATRMMESIDEQRLFLNGDQNQAVSIEYARPEEISSLVLFLLSDLCSNITGSCVTTDGGRTAKIGSPAIY